MIPATRAAGSIGLGASPQDLGLDIVAGLTAHIFEQALENFAVTRFVPDLPRHVELEFPRRVGKIEQRAARRFHRLQLAGENPVQSRAQRLFVEGHQAAAFEALLLANFADLAAAQHDAIVRTRETVDRNTFFHYF